ncbi:DUF4397 domain-containing protein [Marinobacter sediminum]|uniref:DUF4397 domain-containing protein n=1 Tax=Marinobacter sediminum TaxID=256323 RepID=UPI00202E2DF6|nr:DUF4397 domain-containing protein [Marinobacter sediminum]MCM0611234.1 DUF4397 domain-containing protein [Marinobacter sediminum]
MNTKKLVLIPAILSLGLVGCSDNDDDPAPTASVRVMHASADAPAVDVAIDGEVVLSGVEFQQGSGYLPVTAGTREVSLQVDGTDVYSEMFTVEANRSYSILALNELASIDLEALDDTERRANSTNDVTVVHASPDAGNVDVNVTAAGAALPMMPTLPDVPFGANATLEQIAAGDYQVRIAAAGSTDVVYDSGTLNVGADVTAVAVNSQKGASPVSLLVWTETQTPVAVVLSNSAEVRIVHAVDDVDVDVFAGGEELLGDFTYTSVQDYVEVGAGILDVAIAPAGQGIGNAIESLTDTLTLERGESYTVIAAGGLNNLAATQLIVLQDEREFVSSDEAKVRLVHAASASVAQPVDIFVVAAGTMVSGDPDFPDVLFGQDTGYVTLAAPAGYDVVIAADGTTTAAVPGTDGITLGTGGVATAIALGASGGNLSALILDDLR